MGNRRFASGAALLAAASLIAVACGDDKGASKTTTAPSVASTTGASTATTTGGGAATTTGTPATGDPIEVSAITALTGPIAFPELKAGIEAAAKAINAAGGVKGHPLKVSVCDGKSPTDPNPSIQCARDFAAGKSVVDLANYSSFGDQVLPVYKQVGMAAVGSVPLSAAVLSLDNSFPLITSEGAGLATVLADQGFKKIGFAYIGIPAGEGSIAVANSALKQGRGFELGTKTAVPFTATDVTPMVESMKNEEAVALSMAPTQVVQWTKAVKAGNYTQKMSSANLAMLPSQLAALGDAAEGMYVTAGLPFISSDLPGIKQFKAEMAASDPKATVDEVALNAWLATHAFAQVANATDGEVTRASVLAAWQKIGKLDVLGLLPPDIDLQKGLDSPGLNRLFNQWTRIGQVKNGVVVDIADKWVPIFTKP
jgi:branched-chain amino acid transport system substrate-binding protein